MWQPDRINSKDKGVLLTAYLNSLPVIKPWRKTSALLFALLIVFQLPTTVWAEENYYQIINGSPDAVSDGYVKDRGYSVYFNFEGSKFLLDTGDNENTFVGNLRTAGINLDDLDFVVLSHTHKDHTSGWPYLRRQRPELPIYIPPGRVFSYSAEFDVVNDLLKITPNVILLHTHDEAGSIRIKDELSLLIRTAEGPYLFTTNSHTDFIAKLEKSKEVLGESVFFHSGHTARRVSPEDKILEIANKARDLNVKKMSPSHSSPIHDKIFRQVFETGYLPAILGKKVMLEPTPN